MSNPNGESLRDEVQRHRRSLRLQSQLYVADPPFPAGFMVEVTNHCNHACFFCANTRMQRRGSFIPISLYAPLIQEAADLGVNELTLYSTGEPLLHKNFVQLVSIAKDAGIPFISTTTNGVLLSEEMTIACIGAGLAAVRISINAGDSQTYAQVHGRADFDRVIANVKTADKVRRQLGVNFRLAVTCTMTDVNEQTASGLHGLLDSLVDEVLLLPVGPQSGLMADVAAVHRPAAFLKAHPEASYVVPTDYIPCAYPFSRVHLTAEGFLTACAVDFDGQLVLGDAGRYGLREVWLSEPFAEFRRRHIEDRLDGLQCQRCMRPTAA